MNEINVLMPQKKEFIVNGKPYYVGKLTIKQTYRLINYISKALSGKQGAFSELQEKAKSSDSSVADMMTLFSIIDESEVVGIFAIILNTTVEELGDDLSLDDGSDIIATFCEMNTFVTLKKNLQRAMSAITKQG